MEIELNWESGHAPEDFQNSLEKLLRDTDSKLYKISQDFGITVERDAKMRAAVDTGHMRASIGHDVQKNRDGVVIIVGTEVNYAIYVEMGTEFMDAQPFLEPAFKNNLNKLEREIIQAVFAEAEG